MTQTKHYDAIVIGAGQAGVPLSTTLAKAGWKTALIERAHVGGTCINEGCTPTKTMVASGRVAYLARRAADYGVHTGAVGVDMAQVRQRKRDIVADWSGRTRRRLLRTAHLDLIDGEAHFTGPRSLEVQLSDGGSRQITGERIILNTGARPSLPPLPG